MNILDQIVVLVQVILFGIIVVPGLLMIIGEAIKNKVSKW
jgi:hypothetical protein